MARSEESLRKKYLRNEEYKKETYERLYVRLSKKYDADIIEWVNSKSNKRQYILNLIRKDIESSGK